MGVAAAELDGGSSTQRSVDIVGVSDWLPGMGMGVSAAVGGVAVAGMGSSQSHFEEAAVIPGIGASDGGGESPGTGEFGMGVAGPAEMDSGKAEYVCAVGGSIRRGKTATH